MKVVIIGAGIMGITFATLARELSPNFEITVIERLSGPAKSNTDVFNNAGTGHEANCELNYTPMEKGKVDISKALTIHAQFNVAKQFWAYLVKKGVIKDPASFIRRTKHCTLVSKGDITELKQRFEAMRQHHFFEQMEYSEDHQVIESWIPYTMEDRPDAEHMAATKIETGTDVNFQTLTEQMSEHLQQQEGFSIHYNMHVNSIQKTASGGWLVSTTQNGKEQRFEADVLFVGAGGGAFPLLKQSGLSENKRYAGFPVGGRFLMAKIDEASAYKYTAKTYGKAKVGAPPMSVPHLDLRNHKGEHYLLFGPFATFMPVLEKNRSFFEYVKSIRIHDIPGFMKVLVQHFSLLKYLIGETVQSRNSMLGELDSFAPGISRKFDWKLIQAGQRVQVIKDGNLQLGTEIVVSADRTYGTLLGASPGASVSPEVMLRLCEQVFSQQLREPAVQAKLKEIFPVAELKRLEQDAPLYRQVRDEVNAVLGITV